jgi:hypothetical protein
MTVFPEWYRPCNSGIAWETSFLVHLLLLILFHIGYTVVALAFTITGNVSFRHLSNLNSSFTTMDVVGGDAQAHSIHFLTGLLATMSFDPPAQSHQSCADGGDGLDQRSRLFDDLRHPIRIAVQVLGQQTIAEAGDRRADGFIRSRANRPNASAAGPSTAI